MICGLLNARALLSAFEEYLLCICAVGYKVTVWLATLSLDRIKSLFLVCHLSLSLWLSFPSSWTCDMELSIIRLCHSPAMRYYWVSFYYRSPLWELLVSSLAYSLPYPPRPADKQAALFINVGYAIRSQITNNNNWCHRHRLFAFLSPRESSPSIGSCLFSFTLSFTASPEHYWRTRVQNRRI